MPFKHFWNRFAGKTGLSAAGKKISAISEAAHKNKLNKIAHEQSEAISRLENVLDEAVKAGQSSRRKNHPMVGIAQKALSRAITLELEMENITPQDKKSWKELLANVSQMNGEEMAQAYRDLLLAKGITPRINPQF